MLKWDYFSKVNKESGSIVYCPQHTAGLDPQMGGFFCRWIIARKSTRIFRQSKQVVWEPSYDLMGTLIR